MSEKEFYRAIKNGDLITVRQLLKTEPELVQSRDKEASTGLHYAAWKGHEELIDLLIDAGADIQAHNENDHWGTTPLHAAAHGNQAKAAAALIRRGAVVHAVKSTGSGTPLDETKVHNATAVAKLLMRCPNLQVHLQL